MRVSPDGKYLYLFRSNILIFDTTEFKLAETIELSKPLQPGMETIFLGGSEDPHELPGTMTAVFNATDPVVHRPVFGIADFNLSNRTFSFTPVGPTADGMLGLRVTPDRKTGYTVAINGTHGNRVTEFWVFDMNSRRITNKAVFQGRTRFQFSLSSDGRKLYIYGAGNSLEVYDAATLKMEKDIVVEADMTTNMVVVPPGAPPAAEPQSAAR
jgi:DNA-binding beta-propeller fold protein YncE